MKMQFVLLMLSFLAIASGDAKVQSMNPNAGKRFVGTSVFVLANLVPDQVNPPGFFQLNCGYWLTEKDVFSLEAITWKYNAPKGIPYGSSFENPDEEYPGYIREFGIGIAYQRFIWKGLYAATHVLPLIQKYAETGDNNATQSSFTLFLTLRTGYHIKIFRNRFFVEPSVACTYWPVTTNAPSSFSAVDKRWPNYFLFEPGLHCGFKF